MALTATTPPLKSPSAPSPSRNTKRKSPPGLSIIRHNLLLQPTQTTDQTNDNKKPKVIIRGRSRLSSSNRLKNSNRKQPPSTTTTTSSSHDKHPKQVISIRLKSPITESASRSKKRTITRSPRSVSGSEVYLELAASSKKPHANRSSSPSSKDLKSNKEATAPVKHPYSEQCQLRSLEALRDAADLSSINASLTLVHETHAGCKMHPSAEQLVRQAEVASQFLTYHEFLEHFTQPKLMGGLAYSNAKSEKLFQVISVLVANKKRKRNVVQFWMEPFDASAWGNMEISKLDQSKIVPLIQRRINDNRSALDSMRDELKIPH